LREKGNKSQETNKADEERGSRGRRMEEEGGG